MTPSTERITSRSKIIFRSNRIAQAATRSVRDQLFNLMEITSKRMLSSLPKSARGAATRYKVTNDRMKFTRKH